MIFLGDLCILARFQQRLKEESDQAGPGSNEQLRYRHYLSNCSPTSAVNASSKDDRTSTQRDDQLAANSTAAHNFIEDLDLLLINQDHRQH